VLAITRSAPHVVVRPAHAAGGLSPVLFSFLVRSWSAPRSGRLGPAARRFDLRERNAMVLLLAAVLLALVEPRPPSVAAPLLPASGCAIAANGPGSGRAISAAPAALVMVMFVAVVRPGADACRQ
jgi:hypothetical protein